MESIELTILVPAFVAGVLVLLTHVPLGQEVIRRGIIFIDLAVAQIAGLGVIAASQFGWDAHGWEVQLSAMACALAGALFLGWIEKRWPEQQEALIGVVFVLAATAAILLLANNPQGGEYLRELLVGQILWVSWDQLLPVAALSFLVFIAWFRFKAHLGRMGFYFLFALAITISVQLVGIYLVFASLIIPALGSLCCREKNRLLTGYVIGVLGYANGLVLSSIFDLPSGAMIVWSIAIVAIVVGFIMKEKATQ